MGRVSERVRNPAVERGQDLRIHLLGTPTVQRGGVRGRGAGGAQALGPAHVPRAHRGSLVPRTPLGHALPGGRRPARRAPLGALGAPSPTRPSRRGRRQSCAARAPNGGVRRRRDPAHGLLARSGLAAGPRARPPRRHGLPLEPGLRGLARQRAPSRRRARPPPCMHEAALALLARGEVDAARSHAAHLVRLNPYDENAHVLLVRCLRASGDADAARASGGGLHVPLSPGARDRAEPGARLGGGGAARLGRNARLRARRR